MTVVSLFMVLLVSILFFVLPIKSIEDNRGLLLGLIITAAIIFVLSAGYLILSFIANPLRRLYKPIEEHAFKFLIYYNLNTETVHLNYRLSKLLGISKENLTIEEFRAFFVNPEDIEFDYDKLSKTNIFVSKLSTKTNKCILFSFFPNIFKGQKYIVGYAADFTEQEGDQAALIKAARLDTLTGAYRRSYFIKNVKEKMANPASKGVLTFMDIDNFKGINDKYGHTNGDVVLIKLSSVLKDYCLDKKAFVGRMGGDEFVIYFYDMKDYKVIYQYLKEIEIAIKTISFQSIGLKQIDVSMGVSYFPLHSTDFDLLLKYADDSLYRSKCVPGTAFTIYNEGKVNEEFETINASNFVPKGVSNSNDIFSGLSLNEIEEILKKALQKKEFLVYIQPEIALNNGGYKGECLVRWNSKEYGLIYPSNFIPYLERTNLITNFDYYMFNEVLNVVEKHVKGDSNILVAVNQSIKTMVDPEYETHIREIFTKHKVLANSIAIEISERAMFTGLRHINKAISLFHSLGLKILIDDFGDGYTSLDLLKDLDVDMIKIDRSFLTNQFKDNERSAKIIKGIANLSRDLKIVSILEGIETKEQLKVALDSRVDYVQGFIFASVIPCDVFFNPNSEIEYKKSLNRLIGEIDSSKK